MEVVEEYLAALTRRLRAVLGEEVARSQHFLDTGHWISKRDVL